MAKTKHMQSFIWYCLVILISLTTVLPFIWTLSTSFKSDSEILSGSMQIGFFVSNYWLCVVDWLSFKETAADVTFAGDKFSR